MRKLCFTVDLDRDVNIQVPGQRHAGSISADEKKEPRYSSSERGLEIIIGVLDELGVKATFFAEAETLTSIGNRELLTDHEVGIHGWQHEDLTLLDDDDKRTVLQRSVDAVSDITGKRPVCFRAPYMKVNEDLMDILPSLGIRIDSSSYAEISGSFMPYKLKNGIVEVPVPEGKDPRGKKISAFLWPMHEGKRAYTDYIEMASVMEEGTFTIATHTWHMTESRERGKMSEDEIKTNIDNTRMVLEGIMDMGMRPLTLSDAVGPML